MNHESFINWVQWVYSRAAARRREWCVLELEPDTQPWAKEAVAEFLGSIRLEWAAERKEWGL